MDETPDFDIENRRNEATRLLDRIRTGEEAAVHELLPLVYEQLRRMAAAQFRAQPDGHTLQPTALVHEAFVKLIRNPDKNWKNRGHFFAVAAAAMRQILTDHARTKARAKRGGNAVQVTLSEIASPSGETRLDILELEPALNKLAELAPRQARIIELWFFTGLTMEEVAEVLAVSPRTVRRDWRHAHAWLNREIAAARNA